MPFDFGDVVLVPFPFTNQTTSKKRPAVVVSSELYNSRGRDVILMAITSRLVRPADAVGEILIADWHGAGLPKPSLIKPVVATVEPSLVLKTLGHLGAHDLVELRRVIAMVIG